MSLCMNVEKKEKLLLRECQILCACSCMCSTICMAFVCVCVCVYGLCVDVVAVEIRIGFACS